MGIRMASTTALVDEIEQLHLPHRQQQLPPHLQAEHSNCGQDRMTPVRKKRSQLHVSAPPTPYVVVMTPEILHSLTV